MTGKLIPFGYSIPNAQTHLAELMQDEHAILVDIRDSVASLKKPDWSKATLEAQYGKRYIWIQELGNVNFLHHDLPIKLRDPEAGIPRLLKGINRGYSIILLCTCARYDACHRGQVVKLVQEQMPDIEVVLPVKEETVSCLSIQQPWSWLIVNGLKNIENRDWTVRYQGPLLIHAGKKVDPSCFLDDGGLSPGFERKYGSALAAMMPQHKSAYPTGVIVGVVQMTGVVTKSDSPWFRGRFGFMLEQAKPLLEPIPYRGAQNIFPVPYVVVAGATYGVALTPPALKPPHVATPEEEMHFRVVRTKARCDAMVVSLDELMVRHFNGMRTIESLDLQEYARLNTALLRLELEEAKRRKKESKR